MFLEACLDAFGTESLSYLAQASPSHVELQDELAAIRAVYVS